MSERARGLGPVVVIDDHPLIGIALVGALHDAGLVARSCAPGAVDAQQLVGAGTLVLLDLDLGCSADGSRIESTTLIHVMCAAGATVLVVTGSSDEAVIAAAVAAGAVGWLSKTMPFEGLLSRILAVASGGPAISGTERERLLELHESRSLESRDLERRWSRLTPRERAVLRRLVGGHRAAAIAEEFVVSMATVRTQIRSILAKLEVGSQLEAVAVARQRG